MDDLFPNLKALHPRLFIHYRQEVLSNLPAGWLPIANGVCTEIERLSDERGVEVPQIRQIKEKLGSLRLSLSFGDNLDQWNSDPLRASTREQVRRLIETASLASEITCTVCGRAGLPFRRSERLTVLCANHAGKQFQET